MHQRLHPRPGATRRRSTARWSSCPTDAEIDERHAAGQGLTSPELAVLRRLREDHARRATCSTPASADEPWYGVAAARLLPARCSVERFGDRLDGHPLRREIVATTLVNDLVNRGGITFVFRACEETGATPVEIARAYAVVREVFGLRDFWDRIEALDALVPTAAQTALYLECRRLLDRATRWLLQARRTSIDVQAEIEHFAPVAARRIR